MSSPASHSSRPPAPPGSSRLLWGLDGAEHGALRCSDHLSLWGVPPRLTGRAGAAFIEELARSGLHGHGGAWFPTAVKWRSVASRRLGRPVVVVNGAEGEPASRKDRLLLERTPHLVLDGAGTAAAALGASRVVVYVPRPLVAALKSVVEERRKYHLDPVIPEVVAGPDRFVAGEESALVGHLNGGPGALPGFTALRPVYERGVNGHPTLVQNAETLSHVALIARFGADWFRQVGTPDSPGTALLTVTLGSLAPRVAEVPHGRTLRTVFTHMGAQIPSLGAVLLGGYGGTWLRIADALDVPLAEEYLRPIGGTLGAGVVIAATADTCPVLETARIVRYLDQQGAGQCGPCVNGLSGLADAMERIAVDPTRGREAPRQLRDLLEELCSLIDKRGACHHPDGAARMVRSMLRAFPEHVDSHQRNGPCQSARAAMSSQATQARPQPQRRPGTTTTKPPKAADRTIATTRPQVRPR